MDERLMQFRVGLMVAASLLVTGILVVMFAEPGKLLPGGSYSIKIVFDQAPGVISGTPVRKSGIRIGAVRSVEFAKDRQGRQDTKVLVTADIDADKRIYEDEVCRLQSNLLGDAVLEFVRAPRQTDRNEAIPENALIPGLYRPDPASAIGDLQNDLQSSIREVTATAGQLQEVGKALTITLKHVNGILEENRDTITGTVTQARTTLESVGQVADNANKLLGDPESQRIIKEQIRRLPQIIEDAQRTIQGLERGVKTITETAADVKRVTGALGDEQSVAQIKDTLASLAATGKQLEAFSKAANNPDGSLGKLVNDPELYQHLNRAALNVEQLTRELKPIIDDARVISDKVSRHPGVLLRDAVKPGAGIK